MIENIKMLEVKQEFAGKIEIILIHNEGEFYFNISAEKHLNYVL
jgi:hypothetical protein